MSDDEPDLIAQHRAVAANLHISAREDRRIKGSVVDLLGQFGYAELTPEIAAYLEATLGQAGLKTRPSLASCTTDSKITLTRSGRVSAEPERIYQGSADRVFQAALRAIGDMGHSITHTDAATRTVSFNTGMSAKSWSGQDMTVSVFPEGDLQAKVVAGGHRAQRGSIFGGGGQLIDLGEKHDVVRLFFIALDRSFAHTPELSASSEPSGEQSMTAELERLASLRSSGHLTDDEFQAAKARLLS